MTIAGCAWLSSRLENLPLSTFIQRRACHKSTEIISNYVTNTCIQLKISMGEFYRQDKEGEYEYLRMFLIGFEVTCKQSFKQSTLVIRQSFNP